MHPYNLSLRIYKAIEFFAYFKLNARVVLLQMITHPINWITPEQDVKTPPPRTLFAFIRWCLNGTYAALILAAFASILSGVVETFTAALIGYVIDLILESTPQSLIAEKGILLLAAVGFLFFIRPIFFFFSNYMQSIVISPNIRSSISIRIHRWTLGHSKSYFDNDFAGRIAQKEIQASRSLTDVVVELIHTVLFALASVATSFWIVSLIDWRAGLIVVIWFAGFYAMMAFFMPRIKITSSKRANAQAEATGQIVDTVSNINLVKLFANSKHEDRAAIGAFAKLREALITYGNEIVWFRTCILVYASLIFVAVTFCTIILWTNGSATPGEVVASGSVAMRLMMMAGWVSFSLMAIYTNLGEVEDAMRTLAAPHDMSDSRDAKKLIVQNGDIEFRNVTFAYGQKKGGLKDISLSIKRGEKLGVVGASGAGKSTLIALLLRLYDAEKGDVLIDNQNVRDVTQESLRSCISVVSQETSMFNRTARENIIYGKADATELDMIEAAKNAGAHEFILDLLDNQGRTGYNAYLGERGVKLSGGQRQRIALGRAIIKDAPILVLDEATSALDSEVESVIQKALQHIMVGKTVFAIAHRLSTIAHMDRIIVMDEGQIIEQGTHSSLLELNGIYAGYWNRQSGGFLGFDVAAE